jgi:outer membrane protein assembly factor BamE (lipoprotein component of BamABCDE complex)
MRPALAVIPLVVATLAAGCLSTSFGREFPSPDPRGITVGKTDKGELRRLFGEPYQVGIDSGDATWRWFFGRRSWGTEQTKDLSVRFNSDGRVKSYAFTSNFPDDMTQLK